MEIMKQEGGLSPYNEIRAIQKDSNQGTQRNKSTANPRKATRRIYIYWPVGGTWMGDANARENGDTIRTKKPGNTTERKDRGRALNTKDTRRRRKEGNKRENIPTTMDDETDGREKRGQSGN